MWGGNDEGGEDRSGDIGRDEGVGIFENGV